MGLKPLYLPAGRNWTLRDLGPALGVQAPGRALTWYPYTRLSRVVSATDAQWLGTALVACLQHGVPVIFTDGHGEPQGYCYGNRRRETTLDGLLHMALDMPDWHDRYRFWRKAMRHRLAAQALARAGIPRAVHTPAAARSHLCNHHHQRLLQRPGPLLSALRAPLHALAAARLMELLTPERLGHPAPGFCLVRELGELLQWPAHALLDDLEPWDLAEADCSFLAASLVEAHGLPLRRSLEFMLTSLEIWLRGWAL